MKFKTLFLVFALLLMGMITFAQQDKISVDFTNQPVQAALKTLFAGSGKNYQVVNGVYGVVTLTVKDMPFNTVLQMILSQVGATYEFKNSVYTIKPDMNAMQGGMNPGMPGMGGNMPGMGGMNPGMGGMNPGMGGMNPGMPGMAGGGINPGMGGQMGMNGQQVSTVNYKDQKIKAIKINYNSPNQILSLMDGDDYVDVVYYGSGSSGSSSDSSSSSSSSSSGSSRSSSRSSNR